jgi:hypothetical protein
MAGNAEVALERLKADERLDVSSQLQAARLAYFKALDTHEDLDRAKFTCEYYLTQFSVLRSSVFFCRKLQNRKLEAIISFLVCLFEEMQLPDCACKNVEIREIIADAWCLIHQKSRDEMKMGASVGNTSFVVIRRIYLLMNLCSQLLRELTGNKELRRDSLFYIATVQFRMEQYLDARK